MSSLVVTGGATYEGVGFTNVDSLIVETDSDPELNPEIASLLRPSLGLGYRPEDRNDLLRSVKIESKKKPLTFRGDDGLVISKSPPVDIPDSISQRNTSRYDVSAMLPVNLEAEKNKAQMKEDQINDAEEYSDDDLVVTPNSKNTEGGDSLTHKDAPDADIGDVDGGFDGGDLLFKFEGGGEGSDDEFEGGAVDEYFSW
jgi:hypothetical protein